MMDDSESPRPSLDPLTLRLTAANALIRRRRSIKPADMDPRPVERVHLAAILENANWAPTHGRTEPWRFTVFTGDARERLAGFLQALYREKTPKEEFRDDKFEKLGASPLQAPVAILVGMKRQDIEKIPAIEEVEAVACAVQNMHLTACAIGIGGFWSTPPIVYTPEMAQFMGLGPQDQCLGLFYLGWPRDDAWPEGQRNPMSEKVTWLDGGESQP